MEVGVAKLTGEVFEALRRRLLARLDGHSLVDVGDLQSEVSGAGVHDEVRVAVAGGVDLDEVVPAAERSHAAL